jgi:hypothetical protein
VPAPNRISPLFRQLTYNGGTAAGREQANPSVLRRPLERYLPSRRGRSFSLRQLASEAPL